MPPAPASSLNGAVVTLRVYGSWSGWDGETAVELTDGSVWREDEYYYKYHHAHRPEATILNANMMARGMRTRSASVTRIATAG